MALHMTPSANIAKTTTLDELTPSICVNLTNCIDKPTEPNGLETVPFRLFLYGLMFLLAGLCLVGNSIVIRVMMKTKVLMSPSNYFIFSLAFSDVLHGVVFPVYVTSYIEVEPVRRAIGQWIVCCTLVILLNALQMASSFNLVGITAVRYLVVQYPLTSRSKHLSSRRMTAGVVFVWCAAFGISIVMYARQPTERFNAICRYELIYSVFRIAMQSIFTVILPLGVMMVLYIKLNMAFKKHMSESRDMMHSVDNSHRMKNLSNERRLVAMSFLLLTYFTVSWLPYLTCAFVSIICDCTLNNYLTSSVRMLYFSNSAVNVFIYGGRHPDFRLALRHHMGWCCCIHRLRHGSSNSSSNGESTLTSRASSLASISTNTSQRELLAARDRTSRDNPRHSLYKQTSQDVLMESAVGDHNHRELVVYNL